MSETYYPPVGFYFELSIAGTTEQNSASFQEVSGISMEMEAEQIQEGGENRFAHQVPGSVRYQNLVLKRGLLRKDSPIAKWCAEALNGAVNSSLKMKFIDVKLINASEVDPKPLKIWQFADAYPIKWSVAALEDDMDDDIVVETLEFAYAYFSEQT